MDIRRDNLDSKETKMNPDKMIEVIITIAIESWRFSRVFNNLIAKLDAGEQKRYQSQYLWLIRR